MLPFVRSVAATGLIALACTSAVPAPAEPPAGLPVDDAKQIARDLQQLDERLRALPKEKPDSADLYADAEVFRKGVEWALKYETKLEPADVALVKKALARCAERADALAAGNTVWAGRKGKVVRGYVSAVDGSVQPFGLIVPACYDPKKPMRLDVVLHGSTKPVGLSELRFMDSLRRGRRPGQEPAGRELHRAAPARPRRELLPLGRRDRRVRGDRGRLPQLQHRPRPDRAARHVDGRFGHVAPGPEAPGPLRRARPVLRLRGYA